ncbi:cytochrome P450 [Scleroderma yunnanense]
MTMAAWPVIVLGVFLAIIIVYALGATFRALRRKLNTTSLRGPPGKNFIFGVARDLFKLVDRGSLYEAWAEEYGAAFEVPIGLGGKRIILCDPKAIAHFYARDTWTYTMINLERTLYKRMVGKGLLLSPGDDHKRQRKSMTPAFSPIAIRNIAPIFYNCAYKVKAAWESLIDMDGKDTSIIEVQNWMNHISLDSVGNAGFSHDFGSLDGRPSSITKLFDAFVAPSKRSAIYDVITLFLHMFPVLVTFLPTPMVKLFGEMEVTMQGICEKLLERTRKEKELGILDGNTDRSIIGSLIKAKDAQSALHLDLEEVLGLMKTLMVAGYETTSAGMTWALLELAQHPDIQSKLREELLSFGADPTYDQMNSSLPYLDAVVHESLRLHPSNPEIIREAAEDDVIPLSEPVRTKSGKLVDSISIARGTIVGVPISCINRSNSVWGPDAKVFRPERWLKEDIPKKAQEFRGHRHLLSFSDGAKICIGKGFAITEIKAVLSVLVKNFVLEMKDGLDTQVESSRGMLVRPKIVGAEGVSVPLRISRYHG